MASDNETTTQLDRRSFMEKIALGLTGVAAAGAFGKYVYDSQDEQVFNSSIDSVIENGTIRLSPTDIKIVGQAYKTAYFANDADIKKALHIGDQAFSIADPEQRRDYRHKYASQQVIQAFGKKELPLTDGNVDAGVVLETINLIHADYNAAKKRMESIVVPPR